MIRKVTMMNSKKDFFENAHLTRQLDLIDPGLLNESITIIGAGAIGSFTALSLAKMGFENITVYDFDKIEVENMNAQFYRFKDIGKPKVQALKELVYDFTEVEINAKNEKYESGQFPGIVISAVDNMAVRKLIWNNHAEIALKTKLIVDGRMAAETALVYAMNPLSPKDVLSYEKTLYSDQNAVEERCTAKSTVYTVLGISSHICKIVKDYLTHPEKKYSRVCQWSIKDNVQQCYANVQ